MIDSSAEPEGFETTTKAASRSTSTVKDLGGNVLSDGRVKRVYTFRDGLVQQMEIVTPPDR